MKNQHDIENLRFNSRDLYDTLEKAISLIEELIEELDMLVYSNAQTIIMKKAEAFLKEFE